MAAYIESGELSLTFKDFALPSHQPRAGWAAEAAWCAADQGKYWGYHNYLFSNQKEWTSTELKGYAQAMGLDTKQFNDCFDGRKYQSLVKASTDEATKAGYQGTPLFLVNGAPIRWGTPIDQVIAQVKQALGH